MYINFDKIKLIERVIIMLYLINIILKWWLLLNGFIYIVFEVLDVYVLN